MGWLCRVRSAVAGRGLTAAAFGGPLWGAVNVILLLLLAGARAAMGR